MSQTRISAIIAVCSFLVAGCGSKEDQMISAIQETLTAASEATPSVGSACLPLVPVDTLQPDSNGQPLPIFEDSPAISAQWRTLVSRGLMRPDTPGKRGQPRFALTTEGLKYLRHEAPFANADPWRWNWALCTGSIKVTGIESYTSPTEVLGKTITSVNFRYTVDGAAEWARDAQVQALNARFARHFQQPVGRMDLIQTNKGWRSMYMQQREAGLSR